MAMTSAQFADELIKVGLLREVQIRTCCESKGARLDSVTPEKLARRLVRGGWLTQYQAQLALGGKASSLVIGSYVILEKLGQGGMGQVLKARHKTMKRDVAVKVISPTVVKNKASLKRFQRECEAVAKLCHPNIVTAHDAGECDGRHFLAMEYIKGRDLSALVMATGPLTITRAVECILQTAQGLAYAHAHGVVHRDIKPANLLQEEGSGTIKILDMGLARFEESSIDHAAKAGLTGTDVLIGTLDYMSPEQAIDAKSADAKSDIYSLGCTMYYLVTGRPIFNQNTFVKRLLSHQSAAIPALPSADPELQAIFERMVAKKADQRYQDTNQLVAALQQWLKDGRDNGACPAIAETVPQSISGNVASPEISIATESRQRRNRPPSPSSAEMTDVPSRQRNSPDDHSSIDWSNVCSSSVQDVSEWSQVTLGVENELSATNPGQSVMSSWRRNVQSQLKSGRSSAGMDRKWKLWLIGGGLGGGALILALLTVIGLREQTPSGTLEIETDQPEIMGAVITIDEQPEATLEAVSDKKTIRLNVDTQKHILKVTKGGFQTLTHTFSVKPGAKQTVTVRLEPTNAGSASP